MLTDKQKWLIRKGLERGLTDTLIANATGVRHLEVYRYRHSQKISTTQVRETRYDEWIRLLQAGKSLDQVAQLYQVKPDSILSTLYRNREFSYTDAKKRGQRAIEAQARRAMGITAEQAREQRLKIWVDLANSGMDIDSIATMYSLKPSTVHNALRNRADLRVKPRNAQQIFDW